MKLLGVPYNKFLFHLLSYNISAILCFLIYFPWMKSMILFYNPKFTLGDKGFSNELALLDVFILSIISTFLIYVIKNHKFHLPAILILQIALFGIVIYIHHESQEIFNINDFRYQTKLEGFFDNLEISSSYIIISSILIYLVQLVLGKKLLPTLYKK